jgi:hypothetical protein
VPKYIIKIPRCCQSMRMDAVHYSKTNDPLVRPHSKEIVRRYDPLVRPHSKEIVRSLRRSHPFLLLAGRCLHDHLDTNLLSKAFIPSVDNCFVFRRFTTSLIYHHSQGHILFCFSLKQNCNFVMVVFQPIFIFCLLKIYDQWSHLNFKTASQNKKSSRRESSACFVAVFLKYKYIYNNQVIKNIIVLLIVLLNKS